MKVFQERGFHNGSLEHVATALGITRPALYYYYPSKEALLLEIHNALIDHTLASAREIASHQRSAAEKLTAIVHDLIRLISEKRAHAEVFFRERYSLSPEAFEQIREKRDLYQSIVSNIIAEGVAAGEFRKELDQSIVTLGLFGMCNWSYQWLDPQGRLSPDRIAAIFTANLLDGIRART